MAKEAEERTTVDMNSLTAAVQKTIKEKSDRGEVVRVEKESDAGKWNYEKDGKYLGHKHNEATEHKEKGHHH
jgi:hypothetical protein